ncbi:hypothetical protein JCM11251_000240 [Rhodosporidiobolus azoricus]
MRPFSFASLATTDDAHKACTDENVIKGLGTIQLSKKATLSHQARFGSPRQVKPVSLTSFNWLDPADSPLAMLKFRYRSRALLQLEGHMPESASTSPSPPPSRGASPSLQPRIAAAASPAVADSSRTRRASSSTLASTSRSPHSTDDDARIVKLEAELEDL